MAAFRCRHFTGTEHDKCAVGVKYASVKAAPAGGLISGESRLPCLDEAVRCEARQPETDEDRAADERAFKELMARFIVAKAAILAETKGHRGVNGNMKCPIEGCGGSLHFRVAGSGHIIAMCSIATCVRFIE